MRVCVVVTPKAGKDEICGWKENAAGDKELLVRVTAPPEGGKATKAVCKVIADSLGIAKSSVTCARGDVSRHKQIEVECSEEVFESWMNGIS